MSLDKLRSFKLTPENLLLRKSSFVEPRPPEIPIKVKHDIVHDLESFFWILCWLCAKYSGPSIPRTYSPIFPEDNDEKDKEVKQYIHNTFESTDAWRIASTKTFLMTCEDPESSEMIRHAAPYFSLVCGLITAMHAILREAYKERKFDGLHEGFIEQCGFAERWPKTSGWNDTDPKYRSMEGAELEARRCERDGPSFEDDSSAEVDAKEELHKDEDHGNEEKSRAIGSRKRTRDDSIAGERTGASASNPDEVTSDGDLSRKPQRRRRATTNNNAVERSELNQASSSSGSVAAESGSTSRPRRSVRLTSKVQTPGS